ncbi:proteinase-activated receptor 1-like [Myxocyprinus asiaticus]|uniref:proteinase-activated receptor 1-like n=1 Tax=Myxocyprinus asiaticus TaxID=70543 RepID=UPI002223D354|nr:proteinase-activated receptor 1-like [Myxocyprinus asiaticus]
MMRIVVLMGLLALETSASVLPNNDTSYIRTFSAEFWPFNGEPFDYLDAQEGSGSDFDHSSKLKKDHHHPAVAKKHYHISQETSKFLTGYVVTTVIPTIYTLVFIISVPLNLLALVMFVRKVRPKKPAVIYMMNLACADLLFVLVLPFRIAYHFNGNNWIYGAGMCRLVTAAFYGNMYCSVLLMMCISVDRFMAVVYPMDSLTWRSPQTASIVCGAMWLLSIGGVMPLLVSNQTIHLPDLGIITCHDVLDIHHLREYYLYFFPILSSLFFFIPLIFSTVCYMRIIQALCAANVENRAKKTRAVFMGVTVFAVFVICFTPTNIILLSHYVQFAHKYNDTSYAAYLVSMCIGSVSCCLDPLIYYFGSSQCQKQVLAYLKCQGIPGIERSVQFTSSTRSSKLETLKSSMSNQYRKLMA